MANLIGQNLGQYRVIRLIGEGGMAAVYLARQGSMKRDVAIKVIKTNLMDMEEFAQRFEREAQIVASLSHAHILKVFDYGRFEDAVYLVMELLPGGSLAQLIQKGPLSLDRAVIVLDQIASALDYAHQKGIIHRDLKPENVLLDESGSAFLTDFGLAKLLNSSAKITQSGASMGTPAYMSPEQWKGKPLDARADVYSLGVLLFEMLSGTLPFGGDSALSLMYLHLHEVPPPLRTLRPEIPLAVENVVSRALAKDPEARYQSAGELASEFKEALTNSTQAHQVQHKAQSGTQRNIEPAKNSPPWLWAALIGALILLLAGLGITVVPRLIATPALPTAAQIVAAESTATANPVNNETAIAQTFIARSTQTANAIASFTQTPTSPPTMTFTPGPTHTNTPTATTAASATAIPPTPVPASPLPTLAIASGPPVGAQPPDSGPPGQEGPKVLKGHTGIVNGVIFSPDGRYVASASQDKTARLWDIETGQTVRTFSGHEQAVTSVDISPDGRYLITGSLDKTAILWDVQTAKSIRTLTGHEAAINSVSFSPDGRYILTASDDKTARLWETQTGKLVPSFSAVHAAAVLDAEFSEDGGLIVTASDDNTAATWDVQSGKKLHVLTGHTGAVEAAVFSTDGNSILTGSADGTLRIWDTRSGKLMRVLTGDKQPIEAVTFAPDGRVALGAGKSGVVHVWDVTNGRPLPDMTQPTGEIMDVVFGPRGVLYLATAVADSTVRIWPVQRPNGPPPPPR